MLKRIYVILRSETKFQSSTSSVLLARAAESAQIKLETIYSHATNWIDLPRLEATDALYRIATGEPSATLEKLILAKHNPVTFYQDNRIGIIQRGNVITSALIHEKNNLPVIKTIYHVSSDKSKLVQYVDYLGGFPIIIKADGGSHGVGVMRIDSFSSLASIVDYLVTTGDQFVLRQYIDYSQHARLIVLGNKVIGSIEYKRIKNDFRSNVGDELDVVDYEFGTEVNRVAVAATNVLGLEFSGTDILIDQSGQPHIAEVNFPCFFPRVQSATGVNVAKMMVDYLVNKSTN